MTAAAPADRAAASRLVAVLEHAWTAIRTHIRTFPRSSSFSSGSDSRGKRLSFGFAAGRWQLTSPEVPTDRPEVLVSGEGLQRSPVDVLGTLLHEAGRHTNRLLFQLPGAGTALYGIGARGGTSSASRSTAASRFLPQVARHRLRQALCAHRGGWLPWASEPILRHRSRSGAPGILTTRGFLSCSPCGRGRLSPMDGVEPKTGHRTTLWLWRGGLGRSATKNRALFRRRLT